MKVLTAVRRELAALRKTDPEAAASALAAGAVILAKELDDPGELTCRECGTTVHVSGNSGTTKAQIARALGEVMDRVRGSAPAARKTNRIDDLSARRERRRAGGAAP